MDSKFFLGIGVAVAIVFAGAVIFTQFAKHTPADSQERDTLYQVSTIDALVLGVYDGIEPVSAIKKHGDFGIGTFDALDGEMIVLDGRWYQAKADGSVNPVSDTITSPFATVTFFETDITDSPGRAMNFSGFSSAMAARLPSKNMIYAVKFQDTFPEMTVRAIPAQQKPYASLTEAAKSQSVYTYTNVTGTVVGFYTPEFYKGVNVPGYHLHFISDDRKTGGHILDFVVPGDCTVQYDITPGFAMILPESGAFTGADLTKDQSAALEKVER